MLASLLAAVFTFFATATGVEKGTPVEFMFAGKGTDRDYETMFVLDGSVGEFCRNLEKIGIPRGKATDVKSCVLWPVGCKVALSPALSDFIETKLPDGLSLGEIIYTGGTRDEKGLPIADNEMPLSAFSFFTLAQSPLLFDGLYDQGSVYNAHKARKTLKKGERVTFTLSWDERPLPKRISILVRPGNSSELLRNLKNEADQGDREVEVDFADELSVAEATAFARALAVLDSTRIKVNGRSKSGLYFRSFLPMVKWRDRRERLTQPFEITIGEKDRLVYIAEDWKVEGLDPKLTEQEIRYEDMPKHPKTDTVFFFVQKTTTIAQIRKSIERIPKTITNLYVYWE